MLAKVKALLNLPAEERHARVKQALSNRSRAYFSKLVDSTIAFWLNRTNSRYILEYRPDSHHEFKRFGDYTQLLNKWLVGNWQNCADLGRFYALYLNLSQILKDDVPGDLVELGVYKGNSASMLATFGRRAGRHVYLFDTFTGFDKRDLRGVDSTRNITFTDTSLAAVQKLVGVEGVTYVQGFFPDSASKMSMPEQIAVGHIDCDLYEPVKAGLELFYPRLAPGGILLLHDYSSGHWHGATQAIDEFFAHVPDKPILLADKSGTAIVRKAIR